jgi:amidase
VGPLARSADDLDLALSVLAGPRPSEAVAYRLALPPARHGKLSDYRVLVLDAVLAPLDSEVRAAIDDLAARVEGLDATVARHSDLLPDLAAQGATFFAMLGIALSRGAPDPSTATAHEWLALLDAQVRVRRQWAALFEAFDVVLAPAFGTVAFPHDAEPDGEQRTLTIDGQPTPYRAQVAWAGPAILGCLPATAVPIGLSRGGLPIGMQVIGPYLEDRTTIGFAGLLAREFGGFRPPPPL